MSVIDKLIVRVKRGDSAATRALREAYKRVITFDVPESSASRKVFAAMYRAHDALVGLRELSAGKLLYEPMARARFHKVGRNLQMSSLPYIRGHARVTIGDDCRFGHFSIATGKYVDVPELIIGDDCSISTGVVFVVNKRITIGNHVGIAGRCRITDAPGHPTDLERRRAGEDQTDDDIEPVIIEDYAWIGHSAHIQRGVTVGEGAVVAPGSVVVKDVPAGGLAMGIPARNVAKAF